MHTKIFHLGAVRYLIPAISVGALILNTGGCTSPAVNEESLAQSIKVAATEDDIDNDPIIETADVKDEAPLAMVNWKPEDYLADMKNGVDVTPEMATAAKSPKQYAAAKAKNIAPEKLKFAAATVLAAMKRMRRYFYTQPYAIHVVNPDPKARLLAPNARGIGFDIRANLSALTPDVESRTPYENNPNAWTPGEGGTVSGSEESWSDIQTHFYSIIPARRRACTSESKVDFELQGRIPETMVKETRNLGRRAAISQFCEGRINIDNDNNRFLGMLRAQDAIAAQLSAYNLMWVNPATKKFIPVPVEVRNDLGQGTGFRVLVSNYKGVKFAAEQRNKGYVNVWEYIMSAPLYAWDFDQQNAVINAYFAANKVGSPFNTADERECMTYRPGVNWDPRNVTLCSADKVKLLPLYSRGY